MYNSRQLQEVRLKIDRNLRLTSAGHGQVSVIGQIGEEAKAKANLL
jgi:hypothetical protein